MANEGVARPGVFVRSDRFSGHRLELYVSICSGAFIALCKHVPGRHGYLLDSGFGGVATGLAGGMGGFGLVWVNIWSLFRAPVVLSGVCSTVAADFRGRLLARWIRIEALPGERACW